MTITGLDMNYTYQRSTSYDPAESETTNAFQEKFHIANETFPYSSLAKDGTIEYNGVIFACDEKNNRITLGDVSDKGNCLNIPLSKGGSLLVNRDNLGELSQAISMFSPEDINLIMRAIAQDKKAQEMQQQAQEEEVDAIQKIHDKMTEMIETLQNGETDTAIWLGGKSYTNEEWEKLLEKYDKTQDSLRESMEQEIEKRFQVYGTNAPEAVQRAWEEASEELEINGFGMKTDGQLSHITQLDVQKAEKWMNGEDTDVLGDTVASAVAAIQKALYDLDHPMESQPNRSQQVMESVALEKKFYEKLLEKLQ